MKLKLIVIAGIFFCVSACTQRTCPTYSKKEAPPKKENVARKASV